VGAIVASAALIAGFGAALLVYGPLGTPLRQIGGTSASVPPTGVSFGNAGIAFASQLNLTNSTGVGWNWTNASGAFNGPCNNSGVLLPNGTYQYATNNSSAVNLTGNVTLVCLNSVSTGVLNATWYWSANGTQELINNTWNGTNWVVNSSYYNNSGLGIVQSCTNATTWAALHELNYTYDNGSYLPCTTYFEMNDNTTFLTSFVGVGTNNTTYNGSTLWSPGQQGYAPGDLVYQLPVYFSNVTKNGTYAISIDIEGVTPVAQTFYFNATTGMNDTVLFTFDMTAAWLMDLSFGQNNTTYNVSEAAIYGSIGTQSAIVTECATGSLGQAVCPIATPII